VKKIGLGMLLAGVAVCVALMPAPAQAATPTAETVTLGAATGTGSWTNQYYLTGAKFIALECFNGMNATNLVTVKRVRGTRTNTVCAVRLASGAGVYRETTNTLYFFRGDVLRFTSLIATGTTSELVFELSP
jgi:hypothetical protein